jgi:DNA polymerase elongation subunit (family B)
MLFFDIETEAHPDAIQFIDEPTAPANYKDEAKIAAYIADKKAELIDRAALDPDYGMIVAIGVKIDKLNIQTFLKGDKFSESDLIREFWRLYASENGNCCGYNIIGFDLPYLMRRSFDLGVKVPMIPDLRRYQTYPTLDLMMVLYGWQNFKSLKFVAKRYGLHNPLPDLDGSQVKNMDADTLRSYVESDVMLVYQLYKRMEGVYF